MKADEFCNKALEYEKLPTLYKLGKFMNSYSGKYLLCDCSGLIKGILWGYPHSGAYKSNGVPDINADTMIKQCSKTSTNFEHLPVGAIVHMKGHIGIHVGNGVCVESSPKWENGIQKTFIIGCGYSNTQNLHTRKWTKWGLFDYIDYNTHSSVSYYPQCLSTEKSIVDYLISIGEIGNFANRKVIARQNGILEYSGSYEQNVYLLDLAKQGKLRR